MICVVVDDGGWFVVEFGCELFVDFVGCDYFDVCEFCCELFVVCVVFD